MNAEAHYPFPEETDGTVPPLQIEPLKVVVRHSEKIGELVAALAKAQLEFEPVIKDQKNPYYNSKYADLSGVISATQRALAKQMLVIIQQASVDVEKQRVTVTSTLAHSSDQWIENELTLPAIMLGKDGKPRFDAQSCGAAMTYGRRYSYQGLAGVAAEQDDDANAAVGIGSKDAAQAVADRKIAEHKASQAVLSMFYTEIGPDEYEVTGPKALTTDKEIRALLEPLWNGKKLIASASQIGALTSKFEYLKIPFKQLNANS
jgi:ERF superfamily